MPRFGTCVCSKTSCPPGFFTGPGVAPSAAGCEGNIPDLILTPSPIDSAGDVGRYCAMAQATGALLIAYRDDTNARLKLARSTDGGFTWSTRFLDWMGDVGHHVSIAASGDLVAVAYQEAISTDLKLAYSTDTGATWTVRNLDASTTSDRGQFAALALNGPKIFAGYYDSLAGDLRLARWNGTSWTRR